MPRDEWKRENDRIKYGHKSVPTRRRHRLKKRQKAVAQERLQSLSTVLWFGKHRGNTIKNVMEFDPTYLRWLAATTPHGWKMEALVEFLKKLQP